MACSKTNQGVHGLGFAFTCGVQFDMLEILTFYAL